MMRQSCPPTIYCCIGAKRICLQHATHVLRSTRFSFTVPSSSNAKRTIWFCVEADTLLIIAQGVLEPRSTLPTFLVCRSELVEVSQDHKVGDRRVLSTPELWLSHFQRPPS